MVNADGTCEWGPGNGAADTNLYRSGASALKTDDGFTAYSVTASTGDVVATAGDVQSGDDLLCGDDLTLSSVDPIISTTGTGSDLTFKSNTAIDGAGPDFNFCPALNRDANTAVARFSDNNCAADLWTLDSDGDGVYTGDLAVNGATSADITTTTTTASVFNSTATTVSIAGAGDLVISGGSGSTGCTVTGSTGDLVCSGDATFAGGRITGTTTVTVSDVAASATATSGSTVVVMGGGSLAGGVIRLQNTLITQGSISCFALVDGAGISSHAVSFTSADAAWTIKSFTVVKGDHATGANGSYVQLGCTGSSDLAPSGTVDFNGAVYVEF